MIIQSAAEDGENDISFTASRNDVPRALEILETVKKNLNAKQVVKDDSVAKVSIVGVGMRSHPGVAAKMFKTLADAGINIEMISTSEIKVACIIKEDQGQKAVALLHKAFQLGKGEK
jgi:aspartate kinase